MRMFLILFIIILGSSALQAQTVGGNCCTQPRNPLDQLAYDMNKVVVHMARGSWNGVIGFKEGDWPLSAFLLRYSLQDNPQNLDFKSGSRFSEEIKKSPEYQAVLASIIENLKKNDDGKSMEGKRSLVFQTGDLYAGLHNTDLSYTATKVGNEWRVKVRITDRYDFDFMTPEQIADPKIRTINNMAYDDQLHGVIVPYDIAVTIDEVVK